MQAIYGDPGTADSLPADAESSLRNKRPDANGTALEQSNPSEHRTAHDASEHDPRDMDAECQPPTDESSAQPADMDLTAKASEPPPLPEGINDKMQKLMQLSAAFGEPDQHPASHSRRGSFQTSTPHSRHDSSLPSAQPSRQNSSQQQTLHADGAVDGARSAAELGPMESRAESSAVSQGDIAIDIPSGSRRGCGELDHWDSSVHGRQHGRYNGGGFWTLWGLWI